MVYKAESKSTLPDASALAGMPSRSRAGRAAPGSLQKSSGKSCTWLTCSQGDVLHVACGHHYDSCPKETAWDSWAGCTYGADPNKNLVTRGFGAIWQNVSPRARALPDRGLGVEGESGNVFRVFPIRNALQGEQVSDRLPRHKLMD